MYTVKILYAGKEEYFYHPADEELNLMNPIITLTVGNAGKFEFNMLPTHPKLPELKTLQSTIIVLDDKEIIFKGRVLKINEDIYGVSKLLCEGEMTYLIDSIVRPFSLECSIAEFFRQMVLQHNSQVEEKKQFLVGNITVAGDSDKILFESTQYLNSLRTIKKFLPEVYGGYLHVRYEGNRTYLDYVSDYGGENEQEIRFGENLLDLNNYIDPSQIASVLIPTGAKITHEDNTESILDISSVNGGKDHIVDTEAVKRFGWIVNTKSFDGVTDPEILLMKGKEYLKEISGIPASITVNAIDFGILDAEVQKMKTGYWTNVYSSVHGLNRKFLLTQRTYNLLDPSKDKLVFGKLPVTLSGTVSQKTDALGKEIHRVEDTTSKDIIKKIFNATELITGGMGGYVVLDMDDPVTGKRQLPWRILIMDTPEKETALSVIQINKNGIGFSRTGINGPYTNAWTIDGNLVADFITTGTMLADRIRGGTLELGGTGLGRDGSIVVMDAEGNRIGSWDKSGLSILKGMLQGVSAIFGGVDNQNGAIEVRDASGRTIGRWDKDGLYINKGAIEGGTINIGNGTFQVDRDGAVSIESGEISIGDVLITENYAWLGDFGISSNQSGWFYSRDSGPSVQIVSSKHPYENGPAVILQKGNMNTRVGYGGIHTGDISFDDPWTKDWTLLEMLKDLYDRTEQ